MKLPRQNSDLEQIVLGLTAGHATTAALADALHLSVPEVQRKLTRLRQRGLVARSGSVTAPSGAEMAVYSLTPACRDALGLTEARAA